MQTAVITGAASGLGLALANHYASQGWRLMLADINDKQGQLLAEKHGAYYQHTDVGDPEQLQQLAQQTRLVYGGCHLLINCAGVASSGTLMDTSDEEWENLIRLDLMSCVWSCKAFIPLLKETSLRDKNTTNIVNVASLAAIAQMPGMMSYNVAKAGVLALGETLRGELRNDPIMVATACPSFFKSNLTSSMVYSDQATIDRVNRWMEKSQLSAESVAQDIAEGVRRGSRIILSDKELKPYLGLIGWIYRKILHKT